MELLNKVSVPHLSFWKRTNTVAISEPGYNPAAEAFKNFDQDQSGTLLGSLHLDTEDEPRRGASRANSVRFDESALHGHFGHGSRSSSDFFPLRTGSGLGSHPMTERSSSHKSDGRQSAASQSNHSIHLNSLGLEGRNSIIGTPNSVGPPPGLSYLGPLPSIIRCWLDTNFSNETLLYAAICTGSYKSVLVSRLITRLGLDNQIIESGEERKIKLQVYLPEATIQHSSTHSSSPVPQLPSMTIEFTVQDTLEETDSIQIFIGSDFLRSRNADILFSQDRLTIFDDERKKLAVPLVRPENAAVYQDLVTTISSRTEVLEERYRRSQPLQLISDPTDPYPKGAQSLEPTSNEVSSAVYPTITSSAKQPSVIGEGRIPKVERTNWQRASSPLLDPSVSDSSNIMDGTTPDTPSRPEPGNMWGSWRRDSTPNARPDSSFSSVASNTGYQRAGRGRGMKVLKPARSSTSRSTSAMQAPSTFDGASGRSSENGTRGRQQNVSDAADSQVSAPPRSSFSGEAKSPLGSLTNKSRTTNPIGGASAFPWLNSSQQKQPSE